MPGLVRIGAISSASASGFATGGALIGATGGGLSAYSILNKQHADYDYERVLKWIVLVRILVQFIHQTYPNYF